MSIALVAIGAALGAPLRFLTDRFIQARHDTPFPLGTLVVNLLACLLLGVVTGAAGVDAASRHLLLLAGTGFCGTFSTYSTFSYETVRLAEEPGRAQAPPVCRRHA